MLMPQHITPARLHAPDVQSEYVIPEIERGSFYGQDLYLSDIPDSDQEQAVPSTKKRTYS